ncbi:MAG: glycoside hydrolase family 30 beta sandwich domain-containing protein, partial [Anaerolineales bacterium]
FAQWVTPGSVRVDVTGQWSGNALAFETPEGATVLVCANPFTDSVELVVEVAGERCGLTLEAQSFNTLVVNH